MQREWFTEQQLTPGTVVFGWEREFTLWGYTASHSVVLFRSPKAENGPRTRIDLVFKPVRELQIRTRYPALSVRVAAPGVLELLGPDGIADRISCLAVGCHEDDGEFWEPSPFAIDLADGRLPPWRARVLGGGPDGEMTAAMASRDEVGQKGRYLFVVMAGTVAAGAYLSRAEAEAAVTGDEQRIEVVPLTL